MLFLGRHVGFPVALEGALKLKELAYMHAEGFAAGELKHGPIALIEEGLPVVVVVPSPRGRSVLHDKIVSNIQEIRARGARTIVIAEEGDEAVVPYADTLDPHPRGADAAAAAGRDRAAAGVRLRDGDRQGLRRRPAAQPREVRHRRVGPAQLAGAAAVAGRAGAGCATSAVPVVLAKDWTVASVPFRSATAAVTGATSTTTSTVSPTCWRITTPDSGVELPLTCSWNRVTRLFLAGSAAEVVVDSDVKRTGVDPMPG